MDPLATTSDRENENESDDEKTDAFDFNQVDSENDETKLDTQLARSEEIIVVSLSPTPTNNCSSLSNCCHFLSQPNEPNNMNEKMRIYKTV